MGHEIEPTKRFCTNLSNEEATLFLSERPESKKILSVVIINRQNYATVPERSCTDIMLSSSK